MKVNVFDGREFRGVLSKIRKDITTIAKIYEKNDREVYDKLDSIAKSAIDDFYGSYDPRMYDREGDLYNTYQILLDDGDWSIQLGSEFMQKSHHQENDLIYWLSMKVGVHGGFPHLDGYYWRVPPYFNEWYIFPAPYGPFDIESRIIKESDKYIKQKHIEEDNDINLILDDIMNRINSLI